MPTVAERLAEAETRRATYILAEAAVLKGQAYSIGNRAKTMADLSEIRKAIKDLTAEITALSGGNTFKIHRVLPRDI